MDRHRATSTTETATTRIHAVDMKTAAEMLGKPRNKMMAQLRELGFIKKIQGGHIASKAMLESGMLTNHFGSFKRGDATNYSSKVMVTNAGISTLRALLEENDNQQADSNAKH